ncbi:MAG: CapA family protein [Solirubrobacterales bacterium]|nr:CapA family protein [Solirubrobacterales bacterium]
MRASARRFQRSQAVSAESLRRRERGRRDDARGGAATHVPRGPEVYLGQQRGDSRAFAHTVVDAGADLAVGHGPHVLRGMEWYRGRLVAYSLGNFSAYKNFALAGPSAVSGILRISLGAMAAGAAAGSWPCSSSATVCLGSTRVAPLSTPSALCREPTSEHEQSGSVAMERSACPGLVDGRDPELGRPRARVRGRARGRERTPV